MLEDELATRVDDEADVEVAVLEVGVARLGLGHHEGAVLPGDLGELFRLLAGNVDRALPGERHVVEVENLVVERLQGTLGEGDEANGNVEARQPRGRLHEVTEMVQVELDVLPLADAAHGGDETDRGVRLDHAFAPPGRASHRARDRRRDCTPRPGRAASSAGPGRMAGFAIAMALRPRGRPGILAPCRSGTDLNSVV